MRKSRIDTLLVFLLLFGIVTGGWFFTKELLYQRKTEFLDKIGRISLEPSDSTAFLAGGQDSALDGTAFTGEELPEERIAEILTVWESGGMELPHEPRAGQMNMEQAIEAGKNWIITMADSGIIPAKPAQEKDETIHAVLCTIDTKVDFDEKLLSYWSIKFIKEELTVTLDIHAASGQIWKARILMWEEDGLIENYNDMEKWIRIAFPFIKENNIVAIGSAEGYEEVILQNRYSAYVKISEAQDVGGEWKKRLLRLEFGLGAEKKTEEGKVYRFSMDN